jgi:hypothetical protein
MGKWNEFRKKREIVIKEYLDAKKKSVKSEKWLRIL